MSKCYCGTGYTCVYCGAAGGSAEGFYATDRSLKPGDTVDPRTLPVGAEFSDGSHRYRVTAPGMCRCINAPGTEGPISSYLSTRGSRKVRRAPTPTAQKRPPCDACGEELPDESARSFFVDQKESTICQACYYKRSNGEVINDVRARRAKQTSCPLDPSSLPTYDQIAGWLGGEWVAMGYDFRWEVDRHVYADPLAKHPLPWFEDFDCVYRCYLKHPSGQRVEVTAPKERLPLSVWERWFVHCIRALDPGMKGTDYAECVRWLDPDTKTITIKPRNLCSQCGSNPHEILTHDRKELCGCCFNKRSVVEREPSHQRWTTTDPAHIAALEAKLAEQVGSGGQDCKSARYLVERADDLRRAEEAKLHPLTGNDMFGRKWAAYPPEPYLQPGPRLMRHELPSDQRLDRKLTGR